ncbi:unnamed protein product [Alternaria alternata]
MNHPHHGVGEDYSFNPEPGESAGGLPNEFREAYQEHGIYRARFAAHGADHRDGQEYPGNRSRPHPSFPVYLGDQQVERRDHVRRSVPNHIHEPEVDTGNAGSNRARHQQRVESNGGGTQIDHPGMPSYSNNAREAAATPDNNPAIDTVGNQAWDGERLQNPITLPTEYATAHGLMPGEVHFDTILANQGVSPGTEPHSEWLMDFSIDSNPGWYGDAPAPRGQPEYNEEMLIVVDQATTTFMLTASSPIRLAPTRLLMQILHYQIPSGAPFAPPSSKAVTDEVTMDDTGDTSTETHQE